MKIQAEPTVSYNNPGKSFNELKKSESETVTGTNCSNCRFLKQDSAVPINKDKLNKDGGLNPQSDDQMKRAKDADLITLPGDADVKDAHYCQHEKVEMHVTKKMCCKYWDNQAVKRPWKN